MPRQPLERILQSQGFGSRKDCRRLIDGGRVEVEGRPCDDARAEFEPEGLAVRVDEQDWICRARVYLLLHKPAGYECSRAPQSHPGVLRLLPDFLDRRGVQPVGRLDQDTTGLLLLSDDGEFIHRISSPRRHVPKTYRARVRHAIESELLRALAEGVLLHGEEAPLAAREVEAVDELTLRLTIDQGIYHQVKRMIAAAGNRCEVLHREAVGGLRLDGLEEGKWRLLEAEDLRRLEAEAAAA